VSALDRYVPSEIILSPARTPSVPMIAIATHGHTGPARLALGSIEIS